MRVTLKDLPASYDEAESFVGERDARSLGANTVVFRDARGAFAIRLYATTVVRFMRDAEGFESVELNTGGHKTVTTRSRLNAALKHTGWSVYAERGKWSLYLRGERVGGFLDGIVVPFNPPDKIAEVIKAAIKLGTVLTFEGKYGSQS